MDEILSGKSEESNEKRNDSMLLIVGDDIKDNSLQSSFLKFRDKKIKEKQLIKLCRGINSDGTRSPEFKQSLREKFVEQAKRYMGVPYHIKYKPEGEPAAPLYLDCCALVRRCIQDLQDDFGFAIGRWNQSYQMDTLPIVLEAHEMKPGDLVFIEGVYFSEAAKGQKHNTVHVEIFLGGETGEATIGARNQRGTITIFPSYKFVSKSYDIKKYHFRSIETWLDGICKSHCPEHPWNIETLNYLEAAGKRSVFYDETEDDISAGDVDEAEEEIELETSGLKEDSECSNENRENLGENEKFAEKNVEEGNNLVKQKSNETLSKKPKRKSSLSSSNHDMTQEIHKSTESVKRSSTKGKKELSKTFYVSKANGWKLVKAALEKRGWEQLPFDYQFSTRFGLKWVERRGQIDYKTHVPGQLVCHIPNNDIITTKIGLLTSLRDMFCRVTVAPTEIGGTTMRRPPAPWLPETYDLESPADCISLMEILENDGKAMKVGAPSPPFNDTAVEPSVSQIPPKSPVPANSLLDETIWIYKPSSQNRGRGIKLVKGKYQLMELCYGPQAAESGLIPEENDRSRMATKGIIQRYVVNPLLTDTVVVFSAAEEGMKSSDSIEKPLKAPGCKFDIRCYLLIARNYPTTLAFYHPGYCRLALKPYHLTDSLDDSCVHLTNASIQKKGEIYLANKEKQIQTVEAVAASIERRGHTESARYIREDLDHDIKLCLADIIKSANQKLMRKHGFFDLLGCDFMLGEDNRLYLLEVNTNPAMSLDNSVLEQLLPGVIDGAIELVLNSQGPQAMSDTELLKKVPKNYQLIFNEAKGYFYKKKKGKGKNTIEKSIDENDS